MSALPSLRAICLADELDRVLMLAARQVRTVLLGAPGEHERGGLARLHRVADFEIGQLFDPDAVERGDRTRQRRFLVVGLLRVGLTLLGRRLPAAPATRRRRLLRRDRGHKCRENQERNDNSPHQVLFLSCSRGPTPARAPATARYARLRAVNFRSRGARRSSRRWGPTPNACRFALTRYAAADGSHSRARDGSLRSPAGGQLS